MKELNIMVAMQMPIGTEFEVIINGNKYCCVAKILKSKDTGVKELVWDNRANTQIFITDSILNAKFIPIQNPVNFMEAVEAGLTGKYIRVDITHLGIDIYKHDEYVLNPSYNIEYFSIKNIFNMLSNTKYTKEIINDGKWYVKQD